ncbi:Ferric reductase like transmembrane component-containing protein 2 [Elsinoe fawcettii]|nr:Ferric reductase like transmembrane component-containing protein 2 [Elsinoe fawcettii]
MRSLALLSLFGAAHGLIGVGIEMYKPLCAHSCRQPLGSIHLSCTDESHSPSGGHHSSATGPDCFAKDTSFLTTLAWCIKSHCEPENVDVWRIEKYWAQKTTGDETIPAKWTYSQALHEISSPPTRTVNTSAPLTYTGLVDDEEYLAAVNALSAFEEQETWHSKFGQVFTNLHPYCADSSSLVLLLVGTGLPILVTWLGYLPLFPRFFAKASPYIVHPALFKKLHVSPLPYLLGNMPTTGQTLYLLLFLLLNILVTALPYASHSPNAYFSDTKSELLAYVANRTGVLAFALFPLTILFAGRNNLLLTLTCFTHATYLLLHRWLARILTVQIILHSLLEVVLYKHMGEYASEATSPYWQWGIVATVLACVMLVISTLWFRRASYEVFLVLHIVLAVLVLVGSWYHVELLFERKWGYQHWLYAAFAVWFFDRLVRVIRIVREGRKMAEVKEIGDGIVRVDVPGVRWGTGPGAHVYAYFPGLKKRWPWECHPFSVVPVLAQRETEVEDSDSTATPTETLDVEKAPRTSVTVPRRSKEVVGIRLYCRRHKGLTNSLAAGRLTALLEGPYHNHNMALPGSVMDCDHLVLFAGGIGITGVAGFAVAHPRTKLYWSAREQTMPLVDDVRGSGVLEGLGKDGLVLRTQGERWDFGSILAEEIGKGERVGVVVCGPPSFCDDVRDATARIGRQGMDVRLAVEAFSW